MHVTESSQGVSYEAACAARIAFLERFAQDPRDISCGVSKLAPGVFALWASLRNSRDRTGIPDRFNDVPLKVVYRGPVSSRAGTLIGRPQDGLRKVGRHRLASVRMELRSPADLGAVERFAKKQALLLKTDMTQTPPVVALVGSVTSLERAFDARYVRLPGSLLATTLEPLAVPAALGDAVSRVWGPQAPFRAAQPAEPERAIVRPSEKGGSGQGPGCAEARSTRPVSSALT